MWSRGYKEIKEERCSNCLYNKYDRELKRFYCDNKRSDYYDTTTEYNDSCELWEGKEQE